MATHKLIRTLTRGDFTSFQNETCSRMVSMMHTKDTEQPTVEIVSNTLRSDSLNWKKENGQDVYV